MSKKNDPMPFGFIKEDYTNLAMSKKHPLYKLRIGDSYTCKDDEDKTKCQKAVHRLRKQGWEFKYKKMVYTRVER